LGGSSFVGFISGGVISIGLGIEISTF